MHSVPELPSYFGMVMSGFDQLVGVGPSETILVVNAVEHGVASASRDETHSVSAGLDYPGVGPEHAWLKETGRAEYVAITDKEAVDAALALSKLEGILPALESAHAIAHAMKLAPQLDKDAILCVTVSGRGDKDVHTLASWMGVEL